MTTNLDYKPSAVDLLGSLPPLCATMGRSEREAAAAILVRALAARGDTFRAIDMRELGAVLGEDIDAGTPPWGDLNRNPFFRPDFYDLCNAGYARWVGPEAGRGPVEFTGKGREAMLHWVRV